MYQDTSAVHAVYSTSAPASFAANGFYVQLSKLWAKLKERKKIFKENGGSSAVESV